MVKITTLPFLIIREQDHVADRLESSLFPYVRDAPSAVTQQVSSLRSPPPQTTSLRSQKPAWHRARQPNQVADNKQRIIVFVAGGMTYSEAREVYQLSNALNKDIFIGTQISLCQIPSHSPFHRFYPCYHTKRNSGRPQSLGLSRCRLQSHSKRVEGRQRGSTTLAGLVRREILYPRGCASPSKAGCT